MSRNTKAVSEILKRLKETAHRELGPDDYKRFVRKADAVDRELKTKPRNDKRFHKAIDDLVSRLLKRNDDAGE